jgi:hypothetical protein
MDAISFKSEFESKINEAGLRTAKSVGRSKGNFEDQIRAANELLAGLRVLGDGRADDLEKMVSLALSDLLVSVLASELDISEKLAKFDQGEGGTTYEDLLSPFLMTFASRSASRERLHIFTTNYDRLIEFGCERVGLRIIDRFVGSLSPIFRTSRLDIDVHYNPPGIRGEPRFLEGVLKLSKLHGSADWRFEKGRVRRVQLPFGAASSHPEAGPQYGPAQVVYPNAAKDVETSEFPYSELFRDFSAAICRPNSVLVTYGYGFGDPHVNAALADMLAIPSSHILIVSYDEADGRVARFIESTERPSQLSFLIGSHFADMRTLVRNYLPQPAMEPIGAARTRILQARGERNADPIPTKDVKKDEETIA